MNCPVCNKALKPLDYENQDVDLCPKCGGIWFDEGELLAALNNLINRNPVSLQTFNEAHRNKPVDSDQFQKFIRKCPACSVDMEMRNYAYDSNIFIDKCPKCDGIWTDKGEAKAVAKYVKGNPDMDNYAKALALIGFYGRRQERVNYTGRIIAVALLSFYLWFYYYFSGPIASLQVLVWLLLPLGGVFFSKEIGSLKGIRFSTNFFVSVIRKPSPVLITFTSWVWLSVPMVFIITSVILMLI